jgi:3-hydroxybutyrate dehydrogenase
LVTGSVGGLGAVMARALAEAGADIMLTGIEAAAELEDLRLSIAREHDVVVKYCTADLRHTSQVEMLVQSAVAQLERVDILVNNAVVRHFAPIEALPVACWDTALAVNLSAAFHAIRLLLPAMRTRGYGRIVNMTSVYGSRGTTNRVDYVATKAALEGLTRAVAMECLDADVTCHALCPGSVMTAAADRRVREVMVHEQLSRGDAESRFLRGKQPNGRFVAAQSIAQALLLLCSPAGRDMNGVILSVDGGWRAS